MANIFQQQIVPQKPKILEESRVYVYMSTADAGKKGIAAFDQTDFNSPDGQVSLKWPMKMLVEDADPLKQPSFTKLLDTDFTHTNTPVIITHPITKQKYVSTKAEVKLKRDGLKAFERPELVMLDSIDFEEKKSGSYNRYSIKRGNPIEQATIVKLDSQDFDYNQDLVKVKWPKAIDGKYGLVKINPEKSGSLSLDIVGNLQIDREAFKENFENLLATKVTYEGTWLNKDEYVDENGLAKRNADDNTLLCITREAVGLSKVINKAFSEWTYNDFGDDVKSKFDSKLDKSYWDGQSGLFRDWQQTEEDKNTVQKWLTSLEATDNTLINSIKNMRILLGFFETAISLQEKYPATSDLYGNYAFVATTSTYWAIKQNGDNWEWYNTEEDLNLFNEIEVDSSVLQPDNDVPSVGSSGKLIQSDHIHPRDSSKLNVETFESLVVTTNEATENDFIVNNNAINIPYVKTTQHLHNWKDSPKLFKQDENSNEYYWAGSREEFEALDLSDLPTNSLIIVEDDEELVSGEIITNEQLENIGASVYGEDIIVTVSPNVGTGRLVTLKNEGTHKKLVTMNFATKPRSTATDYDLLIIDTENEATVKYRFNETRILSSNINGSIQDEPIHNENVIVTSEGLNKLAFENFGQLVKTKGPRSVESWDTGLVSNKIIVTNGAKGVKVADNLYNNRLVEIDNNGSIKTTPWLTGNTIKTSVDTELETFIGGNKLLLSQTNNVVEEWLPENHVEGAIIVAGPLSGQVKIRTHNKLNRFLLTGPEGTLTEFGIGEPGDIVAADFEGKPTWINNPSGKTSLPQTLLTINPSPEIAEAFDGLVAVILDTPPTSIESLVDNCIYYY